MSHWVVRKVKVGSDEFEAWCLVGAGPGCDEGPYYIAADGYSPMSPEQAPLLGDLLFVVPRDEPEVAPKRDTFPSSPVSFDDPQATVGTPTGDGE